MSEFKVPKQLGACADLLYTTREQRYGLQRQVTELEEREKSLKDYIIETLPKSQSTGVAGKLARVAVTTKEVPQAEDWEALQGYIKGHDAFDLVQRRLNSKAIEDRLEAGEVIPGVAMFKVVSVSIKKV